MSNLASAKLPGRVVWVVGDNLGKSGLEFDWHQVVRKISDAGSDSGRNHGPSQRMDFAYVETLSADFQNRT
jgi:hypothetical protein